MHLFVPNTNDIIAAMTAHICKASERLKAYATSKEFAIFQMGDGGPFRSGVVKLVIGVVDVVLFGVVGVVISM